MISRQRIPEDLAQRAPGPELAAELAGVELSRLTGYDTVDVLVARYRQLNHEHAQYLAAVAEVARCEAPDSLARVAVPGQFAAEEARTALVLTRRKAEDEFWFADDLVHRLPAVHAAMLAGDCDRGRAWLLCDWTTDLTAEQASAITDRLLPKVAAGQLTTSQLVAQLKRLAIAIDPQWARRRYEHALAERRVVGFRNPDGTANLAGYHLPLDRVAAAADHIDQLAKAAKRAGSRRRLDHLRAEVYLGLTDGGYTGLTDADIIASLLAMPDDDTDTTDDAGTDDDCDGADRAGTADQPSPAEPTTAPSDAAETSEPEPGEPTQQEPSEPHQRDQPDGPGEPTAAGVSARRGGIELRVRLSTLLGHDRHPGEIAGWGPVHAELARTLAGRIARGQWRWVLTDEHGHLLDCGTTRARPTGSRRDGLRTRDIVEVQLPEFLLTDLDAEQLGAWALVVADITRQHATQHAETDSTGQRFAADAHRRHPGAAQRRWLQIRDRHCLRPGCRAPARDTQQDHTTDHAHGGPTLDGNLGGLCAHDHQVKSEGGWDLTQYQPGQFRWTSRLGHAYDVPPRPITEPLPDPMPRHRAEPDPPWLPPEADWEHDHILEHPPPEPEPPPPASPDDPDKPPPF